MSFLSSKNKIYQEYLKNNKNAIIVDRLNNSSIKSTQLTFNKQQQEIILTEDTQILAGESWSGTYQFINLNAKYLNFFRPYAFLTTLSGYNFDSKYVSFNAYHWWEEYSGITVLKMRADGYLISDLSPITFSPLYVMAKIKIYNNQLFKLLVTI